MTLRCIPVLSIVADNNNDNQQPNIIFHYTFGELYYKNVLPPIEYNYL